MSHANKKPWEEKWRKGNLLGKGGQGATYLAEQIGQSFPDGNYALKILNNQTDPERRARMYREVAALQTLTHQGVPRVVDTNVSSYGDDRVFLFLVTEFVPGLTMEHRVGRTSMGLPNAVELVSKLTDIVDYCHSKGIVHRDIKPDNIVLRNDVISDPVLLDFGLSFNNRDEAETTLTPSLQQLGNRFLGLPELQLKSGSKRDHRSDLTQLCGLLFYTLTGEHPVALLDDQSRSPHQRPPGANFIATLPPDARTKVNRFFDIGFAIALDRRFQTAEALRQALVLLIAPSIQQQQGSLDETVDLFLQQLAAPAIAEKKRYHSLLSDVNRVLTKACNDAREKMAGMVQSMQSGGIDMTRLRYKNRLGLSLIVDETRQFWPEFEAIITGSEIVITGRHEEIETELFRAPVAGPQNWDYLHVSAVRYLIDGLRSQCSEM